MTTNYKLTIDNNCNNMILLINWYRRDQTPLNFQLAEFASLDKLHELSVVCSNSKCSIVTKLGYYKSLNYFLKAIKRSTKYQDAHGHLMKEIKRVKHECEDIRKRLGKDIIRQKVRDMADIALTQDETETIIKKFNAAVDRKMRHEVKKKFEAHAVDKKKTVSHSDLLQVNVFWLTQFVKFGHRPVIFTRMPIKRYAKDCKPFVSSGGLGAYGPIRLLVKSEHKTNDLDLSFVPIPEAEEWQWF